MLTNIGWKRLKSDERRATSFLSGAASGPPFLLCLKLAPDRYYPAPSHFMNSEQTFHLSQGIDKLQVCNHPQAASFCL